MRLDLATVLTAGVFVAGAGLSLALAQQKAQEPARVVVYKSPT